jgi:hypothetical protein
MNEQIARHVVALVEGVFEASAAGLRQHEADAHASLTDLGSVDALSLTAALEVGRDGGNWQRNLVFTIESGERGQWAVDVRILNEEQATVVKVAEVAVADEDLADVAFAVARAGRSRLMTELGLPVAA